MPSHLPSSFASAAAGQSSGRDPKWLDRGESRGQGDGLRRDNRGPNGTVTLRRTSTNPQGPSSATTNPIEPAIGSDSSTGQSDTRISKSYLLDYYKRQQSQGVPFKDVASLYEKDWRPNQSNGTNERNWGKISDTRDNIGAAVCWDENGSMQPIGLEDMSAEEKATFASDVNSPLKPPPQNLKDSNTTGAPNGRKSSISHNQSGSSTFGLASPTSSRPGTRRRETSDSISSPTGTGRFSREETSFFARKSNEFKDSFGSFGVDDDGGNSGPNLSIGGLLRSNTGGGIIGNGPASPWGASSTPQSAGFSSMGNFGTFTNAGSNAQPSTPGEKRPGFGATSRESKFTHLMPKDSSEDLASSGDTRRGPQDTSRSWRSRPRSDADPFNEEPGQSVGASGRDPASLISQQRRLPSYDTPSRQLSDTLGLSDAPGFRDSANRRETSQQTPQGQYGVGLNQFSPTDTNPYSSPMANQEQNREERQRQMAEATVGAGSDAALSYGGFRGFGVNREESDRSQNSSAGATRSAINPSTLGGISNFNASGGWPSSGNPTAQDRDRPGFNSYNSAGLGAMGDMQSSSLTSIHNPFSNPSGGMTSTLNTIGRGSKLGSLFPAAMQAQMQANDSTQTNDLEQRQGAGFGAIGRSAFNGGGRETDSSLRTTRGNFDNRQSNPDLRTSLDSTGISSNIPQQISSAGLTHGSSQFSLESPMNSIPPAQQSQPIMVMPDRIRWMYLDTSGEEQGPWSGLQMHEWHKTGFFSDSLSIRKYEDSEFEPLGQMIRRIGNQREPFLVPQLGTQAFPADATLGSLIPQDPAATQSGSGQPPFANAFPSFGTTLTADEQNSLEQRKQEEAFMIAKQREFLAQQQVKHQMQGLPGTLHHHSSAHSLQSQPSFGSMTSPMRLPPTSQIGGGYFDGGRSIVMPGNHHMPADYLREDEMARLSLHDRQQTFGQGMPLPQPSQLSSVFSSHTPEQVESARLEQSRQADPNGFKARLREFEELRALTDDDHDMASAHSAPIDPIAAPRHQQTSEVSAPQPLDNLEAVAEERKSLTLTEQAQKAASVAHGLNNPPKYPWNRAPVGLPTTFPAPPPSTTPLPAPTAQRGRSTLPETLHLESLAQSESSDQVAHPSVAPWAKDQLEESKKPSLKEIQEAEAKTAAKADEQQMAARRALHEQELRNQAAIPVPAPGLPTSSTWGSTAATTVPVPTNVTSVWSKPSTSNVAQGASTTNKRTLAEIQREEEARKQQQAAAASASSGAIAPAGSRYADRASKPSAPPIASNSSWSTVGAGGKVKIPTGPAASTPAVRATSNVTVPTLATKPSRPSVAARNTTAAVSTPGNAMTPLQQHAQWAKDTLSKPSVLNANVNVEDFVRSLSELGTDPSVIAEAVYGNSSTINGRSFAEEYLRRKKLAEKGVSDPTTTSGGSVTASDPKKGGWSEVARKGPPKTEEPASGFKVVPSKKKGKK